MSHLELFQIRIAQYELYRTDDELVDVLLHDMATERIVHISKYREEHCDGDSSPAGATASVLRNFRVQNSVCTQICAQIAVELRNCASNP
jgi:hypothetical protein